ncbi:hypothetical protein BJX68DRAFT_223570, partial [Aspergillus pseudodeflectus]
GVIFGLIQLIVQLRSPDPAYHPVILDLCCLIRTLWQLRSLTREGLWSGNFMSQGIQWICEAKLAMEGLFTAMTSEVVDEGAVQQRAHSALWALNRFQAMTRFLVAPYESAMNKGGGGLLVCTRHGQDRYKLESGCTYEDEDTILQELWSNCDPGIFEHIGLKSGGAEYYDPTWFISRRYRQAHQLVVSWSRGQCSAREYFTVGRVFMMLWDVNALRRDLQEFADEEPTVHAKSARVHVHGVLLLWAIYRTGVC